MVTDKGTYTLILQSRTTKQINIGRLGKILLQPGYYLYVGSAFGPGGLKARLSHHLRRATKPHWHIDYLRRYTKVIEVWYTMDAIRRENEWVANMIKLPHTIMAFPGFGASDSKGASHLFMAEQKPDFELFRACMELIPNHAPIHQRIKPTNER